MTKADAERLTSQFATWLHRQCNGDAGPITESGNLMKGETGYVFTIDEFHIEVYGPTYEED